MPKTWQMLGEPDPENWKPNTKYLYTVATVAGWTHQGVKDLIAAHFRKASTKDLTFSEYNRTLEMLDQLPPNTVSVHDANTLELFE